MLANSSLVEPMAIVPVALRLGASFTARTATFTGTVSRDSALVLSSAVTVKAVNALASTPLALEAGVQ